MRTLIVLLLLLVCLFPNQRSQAAVLSGCRTQFSQPDHHLSLSNQIQLDLLSGIWLDEQKVNGNTIVQSTLLRFLDEFQAQLMQYDAKGQQISTAFFWKVVLKNGNPSLLLTDTKTGFQKSFELEQTCKGIKLTNNITTEVINLDHKPFLSPAKLTATRKELIGSWKNTYYPAEKITADIGDSSYQADDATFLRYEFKPDGSYSKSIKSRKASILEEGKWELSEDGSTIIFYHLENDMPTICSAKIKHLQMDELVLEHCLKAQKLGINTGMKSFYFNKQY